MWPFFVAFISNGRTGYKTNQQKNWSRWRSNKALKETPSASQLRLPNWGMESLGNFSAVPMNLQPRNRVVMTNNTAIESSWQHQPVSTTQNELNSVQSWVKKKLLNQTPISKMTKIRKGGNIRTCRESTRWREEQMNHIIRSSYLWRISRPFTKTNCLNIW